ncbi:MAG: hypothetical protein ACHQF2_01950 [Flavobacteriales bacterium]
MSHNQFKIFKGKLESISDIKKKIESFVAENKVSARSIGIEFIEHTKEVFISLGYSGGGQVLPVSIEVVNFGKVDLSDTNSIEKMMTTAAEKQKNVICHELCITDKDEFMMIFMSTK